MIIIEKNIIIKARFMNIFIELKGKLSLRRGRIIKANPIVRLRKLI